MKNFDLPIKIEAIIFYRDGDDTKFFLAMKRCTEDGGFWQPLTGTLEAVDTVETCIFREMQEELGIKRDDIVSISDCIYHFIWNKKSIGDINEYVFAVEIKKGTHIQLSTEHVEYRWDTQDKIRDTYSMPHNKNAINKI